MLERSMEFPHPRGLPPVPAAQPAVLYAITAVRFEGDQPAAVLMGLVDAGLTHWDLQPAPTRVVEVVDRLVEGDTVVALFPAGRGALALGPEVKVDVLPGGVETLALEGGCPGRSLADLPRF